MCVQYNNGPSQFVFVPVVTISRQNNHILRLVYVAVVMQLIAAISLSNHPPSVMLSCTNDMPTHTHTHTSHTHTHPHTSHHTHTSHITHTHLTQVWK